jgi:hypothetical protein
VVKPEWPIRIARHNQKACAIVYAHRHRGGAHCESWFGHGRQARRTCYGCSALSVCTRGSCAPAHRSRSRLHRSVRSEKVRHRRDRPDDGAEPGTRQRQAGANRPHLLGALAYEVTRLATSMTTTSVASPRRSSRARPVHGGGGGGSNRLVNWTNSRVVANKISRVRSRAVTYAFSWPLPPHASHVFGCEHSRAKCPALPQRMHDILLHGARRRVYVRVH